MSTIKRIIKIAICKFRNRGKSVKISWKSNCQQTANFEGMCAIHHHTYFKGSMGLGSYISYNSYISANIGRFTSIAQRVICNGGTHAYKAPFATTSPCFFSTKNVHMQCGKTFATKEMINEIRYSDNENRILVTIGSDCWIGDGAFIVGGTKIEDGAVVLAHAVVTKNVPPYAIVGGVPAKIIGYRYDKETIDFLLKTKWWNKSPKWLRENWEYLCDIEKLKQILN